MQLIVKFLLACFDKQLLPSTNNIIRFARDQGLDQSVRVYMR